MSKLTKQLDEQFITVRANIASELGAHVRKELDINVVPTFMVLNSDGQEIWRSSVMVPTLGNILSLEYR